MGDGVVTWRFVCPRARPRAIIERMCGRFTLTLVDPAVLAAEFSLVGPLPTLAPRYNIAPTQPVATVIRAPDGERNWLVLMRWGLIPRWAKERSIGARLINARAETVHQKPSFRDALRRRRCLVVADGFYEWRKTATARQPYFVTLRERRPFGFAGLWERWRDPHTGEELTTCTLITAPANAQVAPIHERMPVILPREVYAAWLDPALTDPRVARELLRPLPAEEMRAWPVSRRVNNPANDDPTLLQPLAEDD